MAARHVVVVIRQLPADPLGQPGRHGHGGHAARPQHPRDLAQAAGRPGCARAPRRRSPGQTPRPGIGICCRVAAHGTRQPAPGGTSPASAIARHPRHLCAARPGLLSRATTRAPRRSASNACRPAPQPRSSTRSPAPAGSLAKSTVSTAPPSPRLPALRLPALRLPALRLPALARGRPPASRPPASRPPASRPPPASWPPGFLAPGFLAQRAGACRPHARDRLPVLGHGRPGYRGPGKTLLNPAECRRRQPRPPGGGVVQLPQRGRQLLGVPRVTSSAASPVTSGSAPVRLAISGVPEAMCSTAGSENPS